MIPKSEATKAAEEGARVAAQNLEMKIDAAIQNNGAVGPVHVDIGNVAPVVVDVVKRLYIEGGWSVEVFCSQRDGLWMTLS